MSVDHVEGNLLVETGAGDVALGKILGEELFAATGAGGISARRCTPSGPSCARAAAASAPPSSRPSAAP